MSISGEAYGGTSEEARIALRLVEAYLKAQEVQEALRPILEDLGLVDRNGRTRVGRVGLMAQAAQDTP